MLNKALLFGLCFFVLHTNLIFSQVIEFDKNYSDLGSYSEGQIVEQTFDGGYIIGGVADSNLLLVKVNSFGDIEFYRKFDRSTDFPNLRTFPVHQTRDGGFIIVSSVTSNSTNNIFLTKLDSKGNTIWENTYLDNLNIFGSDVVETPEGEFLAIGTISDNVAVVIKTDLNGNLLWSKTYDYLTSYLLVGPSITILSDENYVIGNGSKLEKINSDGERLWIISPGVKLTSVKSSSDGNIIVAGLEKYSKIDLEGNTKWIKSLISTVECIDNSNDGGFIFLTNSFDIVKTNSQGEIIWTKTIFDVGNYIFLASDGGFVITGSINGKLHLVKTDQNGEYTVIYLFKTYLRTVLPEFNKFVIKWYSNNVETIDLQYSIDGGVNWLEIVSDYPADSNKYDWYVPNTPSDNCFLKIISSDDPNIYYVLDQRFSILQIQTYDYIAVNEIFMWISNSGLGSHNPISDASGFYWPGGADASVASIFSDGLVWGGKVNGEIRVNGNTYHEGLQPGIILPNGKADTSNVHKYKIFKINNDWESLPEGSERDRLEYDFNNWPGDIGAPFNDIDSDGIFSKGIDTPKFVGDEVLFYVANDLDSTKTLLTFGSPPIGLEFQTTVWGFNTNDFLKDVVFKKYKIINKSDKEINEMYLSYWTDDDMGNAGDDFVGCDTSLSLGYTYNGDNDDEDNYGVNPPAVGHMLLQGPKTESNENQYHTSKQLTSFIDIDKHSLILNDPALGDYEKGTLEFYNLMQGLDNIGNNIIDPNTDIVTKFMEAGDPVDSIGWYAGEGWPEGPPPKDKRYVMSSGSFTMAPGDTQEVVYAIFMARGNDNIRSVAELKKTANLLHEFWGNEIATNIEGDIKLSPNRYALSQNYPNPFNPTTTIEYQIPGSTVMLNSFQHLNNSETLKQVRGDILNVKLIVYDILGREVTTLVNKKQKAGIYKVTFDATKYTSGIYFYQLKTNDFVKVKKMMLLK